MRSVFYRQPNGWRIHPVGYKSEISTAHLGTLESPAFITLVQDSF
jgi:hypothetical protein